MEKELSLFHKLSVLSNILPFYGYTNESWKLMTSLCKSTRSLWHDNQTQLLKVILKRNFKYYRSVDPESLSGSGYVGELLDSIYPYVYKLPEIKINSKQTYQYFSMIFSWIKHPELLNFNTIQCKISEFESEYTELCRNYSFLIEHFEYDYRIRRCLVPPKTTVTLPNSEGGLDKGDFYFKQIYIKN